MFWPSSVLWIKLNSFASQDFTWQTLGSSSDFASVFHRRVMAHFEKGLTDWEMTKKQSKRKNGNYVTVPCDLITFPYLVHKSSRLFRFLLIKPLKDCRHCSLIFSFFMFSYRVSFYVQKNKHPVYFIEQKSNVNGFRATVYTAVQDYLE